jgi:hypothetical protein
VVAEDTLVDQAADELYGLPPGEFTPARDERAKELRGDGDRDAANAVKALRKPTVAAWAVNQLARRRRKDLDELLSAGENLRAAQEELVAGGDRAGFQEAAARERDLVAKLASDATALAGEAGERAGGLQEKVAATLHAAALDEETAEELRRGRLVRERAAIGGFGAMAGAPATAGTTGTRRPPTKPPAKKGAAKKGSAKTPPPPPPARPDRQALTLARTDERHARRELEAAERAVQHAQERADAAAAHAREATERAGTTAERLKHAKRAQTEARRAHARAQVALEKAEKAPRKS